MLRRDFLVRSAAGLGAAAGIVAASAAQAAPAQKAVTWSLDSKVYEGMLVYDSSVSTKRPIIFMQPDWYGVSAETIAEATTIAGKDYIVLIADMFGAGYAARKKERAELMQAVAERYKNLDFTLRAGAAAYAALLDAADKSGAADISKNRYAIGYCAGAGFLLEHARAGADFKALTAFHVTNPNPSVEGTPCNIKGRVLAVHGAADPVTKKPKIDAFTEELERAKVDWQLVMISNMDHSLDGPNVRRRAHLLMRDFFAETA